MGRSVICAPHSTYDTLTLFCSYARVTHFRKPYEPGNVGDLVAHVSLREVAPSAFMRLQSDRFITLLHGIHTILFLQTYFPHPHYRHLPH